MNKKSYQLVLVVKEEIRIQVGKLGRFSFPGGIYRYTGSAVMNPEKRIERHRRKQKPLRWHIDYLLRHPSVEILDVKRSVKDECKWNQATSGRILVKGFGSSDCRAGCISHLKYQGDPAGQKEIVLFL